MKQFFRMVIFLLIFVACRDNKYSLKCNDSESYVLKYDKDTLVIKNIALLNGQRTNVTQEGKFVKRNGEYLDENNDVFFSVLKTYNRQDTSSNRVPSVVHMAIYRLSKDTFVTRFSTTEACEAGEERVLVEYFYNQQYKILEIEKPKKICFER